MPTRPDVRARILETAFGLLSGHGVAYLTQPRVSRAAGVRQSHLTYYFPTRADLIAALARYSIDILAGPMVAQAERGAITKAQLPGILFEAMSDRRRIRAILGLVAAADEDEDVRKALDELIGMVRARLARLFAVLGLPHDADSVALVHSFIIGAAVLHHARADARARREAKNAVRFVITTLPRLAKEA
jgi:AcrR family transcriptional regulator